MKKEINFSYGIHHVNLCILCVIFLLKCSLLVCDIILDYFSDYDILVPRTRSYYIILLILFVVHIIDCIVYSKMFHGRGIVISMSFFALLLTKIIPVLIM